MASSEKSNRQELIGSILVTLPILTYWIYWTLHPSYWFNTDPAALYFMDSLSVFTGKSYVFVDHPGTPMQVIGSLLMAVTYPFFGSSKALVHFYIGHPSAFFLMTNVFLLAANLFSAIVFYRTAFATLTKNRIIGALAISLMFFAIHPQGYPSLTLWSHNSLNYPIGTLLLVWLYRELQAPHEVKTSRLFTLGIVYGIYGIAQVYFLAWSVALTMVILIYGLRSGANKTRVAKAVTYTAAGALLGIILMLIPIYKELPRFASWLTGITTHTGAYGTGESGFVTFTLLQSATTFWWAFIRPLMFLLISSVAILGTVVFWNKKRGLRFPPADYSMIAGLLFLMAVIVFVMIKAPLKLRYSLSLAAALPIFILILVKHLEIISGKINRLLLAFYILTLAGVIVSLANQKTDIDESAMVEQIAQRGKSQAVNKLAKALRTDEENVVVIYANGVPLKCAALLHGNNWIGKFEKEIGEFCPNQYAITDTNIELNIATPVKDIKDIDWDLVIWPGNGSNLPEYLNSVGAVNVPRSWHVEYPAWYFIHSEILDQ